MSDITTHYTRKRIEMKPKTNKKSVSQAHHHLVDEFFFIKVYVSITSDGKNRKSSQLKVVSIKVESR